MFVLECFLGQFVSVHVVTFSRPHSIHTYTQTISHSRHALDQGELQRRKAALGGNQRAREREPPALPVEDEVVPRGPQNVEPQDHGGDLVEALVVVDGVCFLKGGFRVECVRVLVGVVAMAVMAPASAHCRLCR